MTASRFLFFLFLLLMAKQSFSVRAEDFTDQSKSSDFVIFTENKILLKKINRYFKNKTPSKREIQKFLVQNSYYQSELISEEKGYRIKNPVQIVFVIRGNHFFTEKEIRKWIRFDKIRSEARFYEFIETALKDVYQNNGFLNMKLEYRSHKRKWKKWLYLNISEGFRIRIGDLSVKGLLSRPDSYYENFIKDNSSDLVKKGFYSKRDLEKAYESLIDHLRRQGYLQSKIYADRVSFKGRFAFVDIYLQEGPLTLIRDIKIENTEALSVWEILSHMQSRIQTPLRVDLIQEDIERIEELYKSKGYLNMEVKNTEDLIQYNIGEKYASIRIVVNEGPRALISKISIQGLKKVRKELITNLLTFQEGEVLTPLKKEEFLKVLNETGLFEDIVFNEDFTDERFEVTLLFKEQKNRLIKGGLGLNSQRGVTGRVYSEISHRNLFGWGRALIARVSGQASLAEGEVFPEYELSGRYKEVFIPGYGYQGDVNLLYSKQVSGYTLENINFVKKGQVDLFINKSISKNLKMRWNVLSFENRKEECTKIFCPENPQRIGSAGLNIVWDRRNNIFNPTEGFQISLRGEWSSPLLGSSLNISFFKLDVQNQLYWTFTEDYTLDLILKAGWIQSFKDHIPVSRAFILGGQNSLRGYDGRIDGERIPDAQLAPIETAK